MVFKKQKFALIFCSVLLLAAPIFVEARGLVPCGGYKDDGSREPVCTVGDAFILIARLTNWLIAVSGIYAVYKIIQAGWGFTTAMGSEEKLTQLKGQITDAVVGLGMIFIAFMTINTVVNVLLTRSLATIDPNNPNNPTKVGCRLDLTNPLNYLTINTDQCNGLPDKTLH